MIDIEGYRTKMVIVVFFIILFSGILLAKIGLRILRVVIIGGLMALSLFMILLMGFRFRECKVGWLKYKNTRIPA